MSDTLRQGSDNPELSIVVAAIEASRSIAACLDSIVASAAHLSSEIIVVEAGRDAVVESVIQEHPGVRHISLHDSALTPRLWSEGIARADGTNVALLTAHCVVSAGWASVLASAIEDGASAAGGPIELMADATILDSAIYFLRYSAYMTQPRAPGIAGDNAAYRVDALPAAWSREGGFWESDVNRKIVAGGGQIAWRSDALVAFGRSFAFATICRHRFEHARLFGKERAKREGKPRVILVSPIVPFVFAARAGASVLAARRYRRRFVLSLPLVLAIAACWAAGEAVGALDP